MSIFHTRALRGLAMGTLSSLLAIGVAGCVKNGAPPGQKPAEVVVTTPIWDTVTDYQYYTGRLSAVKMVNVRPRASGYILTAPFKEGDRVKEGELLFKIDPQPYQADYNQAVGNLRLADADEKLQQQMTGRSQRLIGGGAASPEELDQNLAALSKARATVAAMKAARDRAQLNLSYTDVVSPVTGRISQRLVDPGNLVNADTTILTTVVTEDPLYAYFDVDERTYLDLVDVAQSSDLGLHFPVHMSLANEPEDQFKHPGKINFIDNQVVATAGTIRLRAAFSNKDYLLKPGLFVRIRLPINKAYRALLIPAEAIQSDQGRKFVYVTHPTDKKDEDGQPLERVEYRQLPQLGQEMKGLQVVKKGLQAGDRVIIKGMQRVQDKAEARVKAEPPPKLPVSGDQ